MNVYRGFFVWGGGIVLVLGSFLIFVATGWPGSPDSCTQTISGQVDSCYCEAFDKTKLIAHAPGVRQPVNTWFNLYAIGTSFLIGLIVYFDRVNGDARNVMRSLSWIPDTYIFAVLFLGLGSMWFHASLSSSTSWVDGFSMYFYASFLVFYTVRRLTNSDWVFWIGYPITIVAFSIVDVLWKWEYAALILILLLVMAYLVFEIIVCVHMKTFMQGTPRTVTLWILAVAAIGLATLFWALSQTGGLLCDSQSFFQPHGMLWHPLAGVMALLLYFYWREEDGPT